MRKHYTRMKLCYAYSNMNPRDKSLWFEYKEVRKRWKHKLEVLNSLPPEKARFRWDREEKRWRPVSVVDHRAILKKEVHKLGYRLLELALYLFENGWIAPDFTQEELQK